VQLRADSGGPICVESGTATEAPHLLEVLSSGNMPARVLSGASNDAPRYARRNAEEGELEHAMLWSAGGNSALEKPSTDNDDPSLAKDFTDRDDANCV